MTTTPKSRPQGWVPDLSTFGARLALLRQAMGWGNVAEAANQCGVAIASWRNWERDGREPRGLLNVSMKISGVTGVDYRWLALGPDDRPATEVGESAGVTRRYPSLGERIVATMVTERPMPEPLNGLNLRTRPIDQGRLATVGRG